MNVEPNWPEELTVRFEQCDPPGRLEGLCWRVELYDASGELTYPVATAYISAFGPAMGPILDFILVPDHLRRKGYGIRLLRECRHCWPDLVTTDPMSTEGEHLLRAWEDDS